MCICVVCCGLLQTRIGTPFIDAVYYADDIALCPSALQIMLTTCEAFTLSHGLTFNAEKTQSLLRASIISIRGARSSRHQPATECPIDLQLEEGHLN